MGASNYLSQRSTLEYEETHHSREGGRPALLTAATTFMAFILAGWTPLLPYILGLEYEGVLTGSAAFTISLVAAAIAFFIVGSSRSLVTDRSWYRAGGEMLAVGMLAAAVAYGVGSFVGGLA